MVCLLPSELAINADYRPETHQEGVGDQDEGVVEVPHPLRGDLGGLDHVAVDYETRSCLTEAKDGHIVTKKPATE